MSSQASDEVQRSTIALNMIVKNEAHVIARCLKSVRNHIQYWVIVDTGSTDGTQELIKELLKDIPGELHERPWVNFAHNRNEAIDLARGKADYLMVVDADDVIVGACPHRLVHSHYMLTVEDASITYDRCHIFKSTLPFKYVGVLHEYLESPPGAEPVRLPSLKYRRYHEGARSKDKKETYLRDAAVLDEALKTETNEFLRTRYAFYLANSYKDAGEKELAIKAYEARAAMGGGFLEEVYISLLYAAEMKADLDFPDDEVEQAYLKAYESRPTRIEAIHDLCVWLRLKEKYRKAYFYAKGVADKTTTTDSLFVNRHIFNWKMKDELAVAAFYCGEKEVSRAVCEELLQNPLLPRSEVPRIQANLGFAADVGEYTFPETDIPENKVSTGMGELFDRMRANIAVGGTEFGTMLTLFSLATTIRAETLVEIGRFKGASTYALASALKLLRVGWKEPVEAHQRREVNYARLEDRLIDRKLFSIEKFPVTDAKAMLRADGLEEFIVYIDKPSEEVTSADLQDRQIDLLLVDGDHTYNGCLNDVTKFMPLIRPGGYFILHDFYGWHEPDGTNGSPIAKVCETLKKNFEHILIDTGYVSFMVFRKNENAVSKEVFSTPKIEVKHSEVNDAYERWVEDTLMLLQKSPQGQYTVEHVLSLPELKHEGLWLEFGCYKGTSIAKLAKARGNAKVYGFDSFQGLPEDWRPEDNLGKGAFALSHIPKAPEGAKFVVGLFEDTLESFHFSGPVTLAHIDCDLYSSARTALKAILPHLIPGSIIIFDELTGYATFKEHEMKALYETTLDGLKFEWISHQGPQYRNSAALRVVSTG